MIAGVILAAGTSSRLGRPKQLLEFRGKPILQHVVDLAAAELDPVVVVLGHRADEIEDRLDLPEHARIVINPEYRTGQASSLRAGIRVLGPDVRAAVILLGDQPGVRADALREVIRAYGATSAPMVRTTYRGRPGHPVLFHESVWPELLTLEGDRGAAELLDAAGDRVAEVERDEPAPIDVDTPEDWERLRKGS